ncbi:MAG: hypothetical protein GXY34_13605 [Syntrophomonadaceae bacterium]|nr:hypothetical protein [Syntrophomonadaceae bacterium]
MQETKAKRWYRAAQKLYAPIPLSITRIMSRVTAIGVTAMFFTSHNYFAEQIVLYALKFIGKCDLSEKERNAYEDGN